MARAVRPPEQPNNSLSGDQPADPTWDVELLRVLVSRKGYKLKPNGPSTLS